MAALVSAPTVVYSTSAAWIAAPAASASGTAWLEVAADDGDAHAVASFRGDRLVVRRAGRVRGVVHQPCMERPCSTVQGPVAASDGAFAYAVAFPGTGGYVASVAADGRSGIVAEDETDPHRIARPHLVASTGSAIAWVDENRIHLAPASGRPDNVVVQDERAGGTIIAIGAGSAGIAWIARSPGGGTAIGVRTAAGAISVRASEPVAAIARFASVGIAADGTVVAVRRVAVDALWRTELVAYAVDGTARTLVATAALAATTTETVPHVSVADGLAAVRLVSGRRGELDVVWIVAVASGARQRVVAVRRASARLSDAAVGGGRLVWSRSTLTASGGLVRSRLQSAAVAVVG